NAEREAKEDLWSSYLTQAKALRVSTTSGRRGQSLKPIPAAAQIKTSLELRNKAIACLALPSEELGRPWNAWPKGTETISFDKQFKHYVGADRLGHVSVRQVSDDAEWVSLPANYGQADQLRFSANGSRLAARCLNATNGPRCVVWDLAKRNIAFECALGPA